MQICTPVGLFGGGSSVNAVDFDGTTNSLSRAALSGVAASAVGIVSVWVNFSSSATTAANLIMQQTHPSVGDGFYIERTNNVNAWIFYSLGTSSAGFLQIRSTNSYSSPSGWHHILASWNTNALPASRLYSLYIDDADEANVNQNSGPAFLNNYPANGNFYVGSNTGGNELMDGCISELYFAPGQYLDFSVEANRRKFITAEGTPQSLGTNGQDPTGTIPAIYLKGSSTNYGVNSGSGGNFTATGTFSDCATAP